MRTGAQFTNRTSLGHLPSDPPPQAAGYGAPVSSLRRGGSPAAPTPCLAGGCRLNAPAGPADVVGAHGPARPERRATEHDGDECHDLVEGGISRNEAGGLQQRREVAVDGPEPLEKRLDPGDGGIAELACERAEPAPLAGEPLQTGRRECPVIRETVACEHPIGPGLLDLSLIHI